ncbi:MAG: hypothetical protein IT432_09430 [Phycisphaerales bacterium]|nr:hypothetical protein [Phycisphaerales bacterium]
MTSAQTKHAANVRHMIVPFPRHSPLGIDFDSGSQRQSAHTISADFHFFVVPIVHPNHNSQMARDAWAMRANLSRGGAIKTFKRGVR